MTDEAEVEQGDDEADELLPPEDVMHGPDGALDCVNSRVDLIAFWLAKLGIEDPSGSALCFGEGCSLAILHPLTGEWMTPMQIAAKAGRGSVSRIQ